MSRATGLAVLAASLSLAALSTAALAGNGRGGSDNGDSYLNDAQRNPRFIEPYQENNPARYRISNPQYGYDDRQAAAGYVERPRGRVRVAPFGGYDR